MHCEGKLKLSSHNTSYCLIEVATKAGLTVNDNMRWQIQASPVIQLFSFFRIYGLTYNITLIVYKIILMCPT